MDKETLIYNAFLASREDLIAAWGILTDPNSYGIMDQSSLYLLVFIGGMFLMSAILYPLALMQPEKRYVYTRRWADVPDDLYD